MCKNRGNIFKEVGEEYTSKTCTKCGEQKKNLGGNETYECNKCNKIFTLKGDYTRHMNRKFPCRSEEHTSELQSH